MANERVVIKAKEYSDEDLLRELRAKATKNYDDVYLQAHRNHCFRCGTPSLVEVDYEEFKINLCINDGCGAMHLDPGEMEKILEGEKGLFYKVRTSISSVFK